MEFRAIIWDSEASFIAVVAVGRHWGCSVLQAEVATVLEGVKLAVEVSAYRLSMESDSQLLI